MYELDKYRHELNDDGELVVYDVPVFAEALRENSDGSTIDFNDEWINGTIENHLKRYKVNKYMAPYHVEHNDPEHPEIIRKSIGRFLPKRSEKRLISEVNDDTGEVFEVEKTVAISDLVIEPEEIENYEKGKYPYLSVESIDPNIKEFSSLAALTSRPPEHKFPPAAIMPVMFSQQGRFFFAEQNFNKKENKKVKYQQNPSKQNFGGPGSGPQKGGGGGGAGVGSKIKEAGKKVGEVAGNVKEKAMNTPVGKAASAVGGAVAGSKVGKAVSKASNYTKTNSPFGPVITGLTLGVVPFGMLGVAASIAVKKGAEKATGKKMTKKIGFAEEGEENQNFNYGDNSMNPEMEKEEQNFNLPVPNGEEVPTGQESQNFEGEPDEAELEAEVTRFMEAFLGASPEQKEQIAQILEGAGAEEGTEENFEMDTTAPPSIMGATPPEKSNFSQKDKAQTFNQIMVKRVTDLENELRQNKLDEKAQKANAKAFNFAQETLKNHSQKDHFLKQLEGKSASYIKDKVDFIKNNSSSFPSDPPAQLFTQNQKAPNDVEELLNEFPDQKDAIFAFAQRYDPAKTNVPRNRYIRMNLPGFRLKNGREMMNQGENNN